MDNEQRRLFFVLGKLDSLGEFLRESAAGFTRLGGIGDCFGVLLVGRVEIMLHGDFGRLPHPIGGDVSRVFRE